MFSGASIDAVASDMHVELPLLSVKLPAVALRGFWAERFGESVTAVRFEDLSQVSACALRASSADGHHRPLQSYSVRQSCDLRAGEKAHSVR